MTDSNLLLLEQFKGGNTEAFSTLYKKYWRVLYNQAYKKLNSGSDAEEVLQILFTEIWEKRETLSPDNFEHYLRIALRNKCVDLIRKRLRDDKYADYYRQFLKTNNLATEDAVSSYDVTEALQKALIRLPEKSQMVFQLHKVEGYSQKETAGKLHLSQKSIEYHLAKALKTVRLHLKDYLLVLVFLFG